MQISAFVHNSVLSFSPDVIGDILFNGVAPFARKSDLAEGVQMDASWRLNDSHTLRGGFLGQVETTTFDTTSSVLPVDATGAQTSIGQSILSIMAPGPASSTVFTSRMNGGSSRL
jgi:hypothetical protein